MLRGNDTGTYIRPGPRQYPGQWNWDAAFNAIGLMHVDPARARHEIRSLLSGQWADGMVPHIVFHDRDVAYYPGPAVWGSTPQMPEVPTSGITQPPLLATAVALLHSLHPDPVFLDEVLEPIDRWHRWFHRERVNSGVAHIVHPWESGMDNSPRFDGALAAVGPSPIPVERRDRVHVSSDQRPTDADYAAYLSILAGLRADGYRGAVARRPFDVGDVFLTAILCKAEADLARLCAAAGKPTDAGRRSEVLRKGLATAWDDACGIFIDVGGDVVPTTGGLVPGWGRPPCAWADRLRAALDDPAAFGPGGRADAYPPSVARSSDRFDPRRYWRGPVWINTNWLMVRALQAVGDGGVAARLREAMLRLVAEEGFWEYYDSTNGEGLGSGTFSWTAAVTIDLLHDS